MCCSGSGRAPRQQVVKPAAAPQKQAIVQRITQQAPAKLEVRRQTITPPDRCPRCGHPTMVVTTKRKRLQCSNANCGLIIK